TPPSVVTRFVPDAVATVGGYPAPARFTMMSELSGDSAELATKYLAWGVADALAFHAPLSQAERDLVVSRAVPFVFYNSPVDFGNCFVAAYDPDGTAKMRALISATSAPAWMLALPEFDQSDGCWTKLAGGRPKPTGSAATAYRDWMNFYRTTL